MPDLNFQVQGAESVLYGAVPLLCFKLRIANSGAEQAIHSIVLRVQIQIDVTRRHYTSQEQASLLDLFGEPDRWGRTLRTLLWTHATVPVPAFEKETTVDLLVPCTFDFNVAATKYFHGLTGGDLPLTFLFSGTVFYAEPDATPEHDQQLRVAPVSWEKEAKFKLPVKTWKDLIDHYYPNSAWLSLRRDMFERLYQYKVRHAIPTWEQAIDRLLAEAQAETPAETEDTVKL